MQACDIFLWKTERLKCISDDGSESSDKERQDLQVVDSNKPVLHPDLTNPLSSTVQVLLTAN